jgi:uridylate kinase
MDNKIPILVFGIEQPESIEKIVMGDNIGTIIKEA